MSESIELDDKPKLHQYFNPEVKPKTVNMSGIDVKVFGTPNEDQMTKLTESMNAAMKNGNFDISKYVESLTKDKNCIQLQGMSPDALIEKYNEFDKTVAEIFEENHIKFTHKRENYYAYRVANIIYGSYFADHRKCIDIVQFNQYLPRWSFLLDLRGISYSNLDEKKLLARAKHWFKVLDDLFKAVCVKNKNIDEAYHIFGDCTAALTKKFTAEMVCAGCNKEFVNLFKCSRCKNIYYCSETCQKTSWYQHKAVCKKNK